jgi:hypothetical protein
MTHWTEEKIKDVLDGTFTRVTYEGKIVTETYEGSGSPTSNGGRPKGTKVSQWPWTTQEDELLCQMRLRNRPFSEIAWLVNRSEDATKKRYRALRVNGKVMQ